MSWIYRNCFRPALFTLDSEEIHDEHCDSWPGPAGSRFYAMCWPLFYGAPDLPVETLGLRFPNPVGLAAGMDKHATAAPVWQALGFGFVELAA